MAPLLLEGSGEALYRMKYAGRIVHHAKGIRHSWEVVVLEAAAYLVGKAGAYAKHLLGCPDAEGCLGQWYDGSK